MIVTVQEDFETLIEEFEEALQSMGIVDAEFDVETGLRGMVAQILNISPATVGIDITTSISCSCTNDASVGIAFPISGTLYATYDDTSQTNVDLVEGKLKGATVEIYNGNTLLGTVTTNEHGTYSYSYTPQATGNLSIKAVYDSSNDYYDDSASSSVSVTITVVVSSLTLSSNQSALMYNNNESATLSAIALDENDDPIASKTITFYIVDGNMAKTLIGTGTTNAQGVATCTYNHEHTGPINIIAEANNLTSNTITINEITTLNLTTDKNILSYVDNEYATLTAELLDDDGYGVSGRTVSFDIINPSTGVIIENIDTATTGSNGTCSVQYLSQGTGDIYIQASCSGIISVETYVYDWWINDDCSTDKTSKYGSSIGFRDSPGTASLSYSNSQYILTITEGECCIPLPISNVTDIQIEYDSYFQSQYNTSYVGFRVYSDTNNFYGLMQNNHSSFEGGSDNGSYSEINRNHYNVYQKWIHNILTIENGYYVHKEYYNDSLVATHTIQLNSSVLNNIHYAIGGITNLTIYLKNIVVKPL